MCVIAIAEKKRPTAEMIEKMYDANDHGAGIAWREGPADQREVVWEKDLDLAEIQKLAAEVPLPFVCHFRIASVGGTRPELCHPFPIERNAPLDLNGRTRGSVFFHNGHWTKWKDACLEAAIKAHVKVPGGKWSDTRAMAWLASIYGFGIIEMTDEKGVAFGPYGMEVFVGGGWTLKDEIWVTNTYWENRSTWKNTGHGMCRFGQCTRTDLDTDHRCPLHPLSPKTDTTVTTKTDNSSSESVQESRKSGGTPQVAGPFAAIATAEQMYKDGTITWKELKKARRIFDVVQKNKNLSKTSSLSIVARPN